MPFCRNCGKEVNEKAYVCLSCGALVNEKKEEPKPIVKDGTSNGIVGLCFLCFIPIVTWIVSGIGISRAIKANNQKAKKMNLAALIVTSILCVIAFICYL